jgi:hypothetical protein
VRCPRCGNENSEGNRFCGMCGATLINAPAPGAPAPPVGRMENRLEASVPVPPAETPSPSRNKPAAPEEAYSPAITGPSFLGLNKAADGKSGTRGSSGSLDYLLEDEEEAPKRGWSRVLLVAVALLLIGAFGYLRWKEGGFDWVMGNKKPSAVDDAPSGIPASSAPTPSPSDSGAAPPPAVPTSSATSPTAITDDEGSSSPTNPAPSSQSASQATSSQTAPAPAASDQSLNSVTPTDSAKPSNDNPAEPSRDTATADSDAKDSDANATAKAQPSIRKIAKPTPVTPVDAVAEAQRYVYGEGVKQDCDRGLRLLKSATQSNPKAMSAMGSLYSSGTCTPRDLPTAYRWYALALHKQPDNQTLQDDLQQLWGQMTPPERQLAIKLSQ